MTMRIRNARLSDQAALEAIFLGQGIEYAFPDLETLIATKVLVDEDDLPRHAILARRTCELYFLSDVTDPQPPALKFAYFRELHEAMRDELREKGYEDGHCWVPPQCKAFARRLMRKLGWFNSSGPNNDWLGLMGRV
jgi:hypothetical protein